jgi:hypothetical protein
LLAESTRVVWNAGFTAGVEEIEAKELGRTRLRASAGMIVRPGS